MTNLPNRVTPAGRPAAVTPLGIPGQGAPAPASVDPGSNALAPAPGTLPAILGFTNSIQVATNVAGADPAEASYTISWPSLPIETVLANYAELTGRTVLRPNQLPNVSITLMTKQGLTRDEAIQALDSVLTLNGITMLNVGDKFVTAVPSNQAPQEGAAFTDLDASELPESGQYVTKVVKLKVAKPSEVQQVIQGFAKVQNGLLAVDATQTLVIRDYAANVKRMMEMIEKIDVEIEDDYKLEVIPIKYGKVEEIYSTMSSLIGGGGGGGMAAGATAGTAGRRASTTGGRTSRSSGGSSRGSLTGGNQQNRLNSTGQPNQQLGGVNNQQNSFNQRLQQLVSRAAGGGTSELLGDAKIVPDERSNSLIVYASKQDMVTITNIVAKVDRLLAQVLIEAVIMDVSLNNNLEFGIDAMMSEQKTGKFSHGSGMQNNGPGILTNFTSLSSALPGGFSYFGKYAGGMDLAVKAVAGDGKGQVLQTPRVQTSHAVPASFFSGQTVPYITSSYYGGVGYGASSQFQQLEVGVGLNVTPYITPDGLVVMDIEQTIEEVSGYTEIANVGKVPNTTRREATATVSVQDGDTILLGGYIRNSKKKSSSGVPLLKDIPVLGNLFKSKSDSNDRSELIVLLRPTVLPTPHDAAIIAVKEQGRLPGVREMRKDMDAEEAQRVKNADKYTGESRTTMEQRNAPTSKPSIKSN